MNILGISAYYHDAAACLVRDGEIVAAAQEERFTRKKHDPSFPRHAVRFCLEAGEIERTQLDAVVFYDKPIDKFARILETYFSVAPRGLRSFLKAVPEWVQRKLWIPHEIDSYLRELGVTPPDEILFSEHHEAHAASAFFPSPFTNAAILTMDGVGEWPTSSISLGEGNRITILEEQNFPHSLGLMYSAFTYYTGFRVNSGEYKLMGLAPYGQPRYVDRILTHIVALREDGSFRLNMRYFNYLSGLTMTNSAFADLFEGPPRQPDSEITQHTMDVARSVQEVTEEIVSRTARHVHDVTGKTNLCLAGGVALNCVANGRLLREGPFENIWIQPAAGDAGGAVGAALTLWHQVLGNPRRTDNGRDGMSGAYLGPSFNDENVETFLKSQNVEYRKLSEEDWARSIAQRLAEGNVIGLLQGRMEFGPRALGNRSILGDPRVADMQSRMNRLIKFRESFRPFAPAVLEEYANERFEIDRPSPYMLFTVPVAELHRTDIEPDDPGMPIQERLARVRSDMPAITHLDNSARLQTVSKKTNPRFHALLGAFHHLTGCPVLINTSFNVRGEPIVCTPADAYQCFMRTGIDDLVIESFLVSKKSVS